MTTTRVFLINSDSTTPQPETSTPVPPAQVGTFLDGTPVYQGWPSLDVSWGKILEADYAALLALYDPTNPAVTVQYWDEATNADAVRNAKMGRPVPGTHHYGYYDGCTVRFTRLGAS